MTPAGPPGARRVPERQCVACRQMKPRTDLIRLVRLPEGGIAMDNRYKLHGRGAYVCKRRDCIEQARRKGQLNRALRARVPEELMKDVIALGQEMS